MVSMYRKMTKPLSAGSLFGTCLAVTRCHSREGPLGPIAVLSFRAAEIGEANPQYDGAQPYAN